MGDFLTPRIVRMGGIGVIECRPEYLLCVFGKPVAQRYR